MHDHLTDDLVRNYQYEHLRSDPEIVSALVILIGEQSTPNRIWHRMRFVSDHKPKYGYHRHVLVQKRAIIALP